MGLAPGAAKAELAQSPWFVNLEPEGGAGYDAQNGQTLEGTVTPPKKGKKRQYSSSATSGPRGHIFWVVPAFKVNYAGHFKPLTPKEKFQEWAESAYDPIGLGVTALKAGTLDYSSNDGFCGYGTSFTG